MTDRAYQTIWVWSSSIGWFRAKRKKPHQLRYRKSFPYDVARKIGKEIAENYPAGWVRMRAARSGPPKSIPSGEVDPNGEAAKWKFIRQWLSGDLDAKVDLLYAIAKVAQGLNRKLYVAEGKRSIADQWRYWLAYQAGRGPLAAFPGTSKHTDGDAADVRESENSYVDIGEISGAKALMAKFGLCLPVVGEPWHVEFGNTWRV